MKTTTMLGALALAIMLSACGGDSRNAPGPVPALPEPAPVPVPPPAPPPPPPPHDVDPEPNPDPEFLTLFGVCEKPDPARVPFWERQGTLDEEMRWLRSWIDDGYLWYKELPSITHAGFRTPVEYFNVLKTPALTASGKPKDQFHFTYAADKWEALSVQGEDLGYGLLWARAASVVPRTWIASMVEPGSPAGRAGVLRGDLLLTVDGADFVNGAGSAVVDRINAGLSPVLAGEIHRFGFSRKGERFEVALSAENVAANPVSDTKVIDTPTGKVGYLIFNSHNAVSELQLIDSIGRLKSAGVTDLVIDMRYNGGGLVDVAAELAFMIAGPGATSGKTFARLQNNGRHEPLAPVPFHESALGFRTALPALKGRVLPNLGLKRVTLLTGAGTCSASEALINGLRGVDVEVNLIGERTCGKPYAFSPVSNCGTTYFAIQFQSVNHKGFGDYADGIAPTCGVPDDYAHPLGDPAEGRLAAALAYRATGACPLPATAQRAQSIPLQLVRPDAAEIAIYPAPR